MSNYLNVIQLISGIVGVALIFTGLFLSIKKLNKEDSTAIVPGRIVKISTALIVLGLLSYAVTKTCTNYANRDQEYDLIVIYLASLIDVIKVFGFIALIPVLINVIRKNNRKSQSQEK